MLQSDNSIVFQEDGLPPYALRIYRIGKATRIETLGETLMKKVWIFLAGLLLILCGFILDRIILFFINGLILFLLSTVFFFLWGFPAYRVYQRDKNIFWTSAVLNGVGEIMLLLVLVQELVFEKYWFNLAGIIPRMYFLPGLSLASTIIQPVMQAVTNVLQTWPIFLLEHALMLFVSTVGCIAKQKAT